MLNFLFYSVTCEQRGSPDSSRFVLLTPPSPSEIVKRQVLSSRKKKITVGDGWMGLVHAACREGTEKNAAKKKKKKGILPFSF